MAHWQPSGGSGSVHRASHITATATVTSDLWYYRFLVKSADLSRFRPLSEFRGRSTSKQGGPNRNGGRLGRHPPVWGDAKLRWVW